MRFIGHAGWGLRSPPPPDWGAVTRNQKPVNLVKNDPITHERTVNKQWGLAGCLPEAFTIVMFCPTAADALLEVVVMHSC